MTTAPSRFTPSLLPGDQLEKLFVARHHLLDTIVARIRELDRTASRNHTLVIGPRGSGKTHLVALVHHRVTQLIANGLSAQLVWLPEDPWTIASLDDLLAAIAQGLGEPGAGAFAGVPELEGVIAASAADHGTVVVLIENLDQVLDLIGDQGQAQLRHFLQTTGAVLLVATTTQLDRNLSDQARPFYGFFSPTSLEPFTVDEAADMLTAIARTSGQVDLVDYLWTDEARARLRTIEHLAGGQPRLWAALASSLTVEGLRELVDLLLERFDDLTPYYQGQLAQLSPQQRQIVAELAKLDHAVHVSELASRRGQPQRSVAAALSDLKARGWVVPVESVALREGDRRRTYYELAEPMARIAFQLKESRGEPIRLIVDFLKGWFDPAQAAQLEGSGLEGYLDAMTQAYLNDAVGRLTRELLGLPATPAVALELRSQVDRALRDLMDGSADAFLGLPTQLRRAVEDRLGGGAVSTSALMKLRLTIHTAARLEATRSPSLSLDDWVELAEAMVDTRDGRTVINLAAWLARVGRVEEVELMAAGLEDKLSLRQNLDGSPADEEGTVSVKLTLMAVALQLGWPGGQPDVDPAARLPWLERLAALQGEVDGTLPDRNPGAIPMQLGFAYFELRDMERAREAFREAAVGHLRTYGPDDERTLRAQMLSVFAVMAGNERYDEDSLAELRRIRTVAATRSDTSSILAAIDQLPSASIAEDVTIEISTSDPDPNA